MFIPMYKKGRALNFGKKYPGIKIETVIAKDPEYVVWCLEHVEHFDLDNELYGLLENELRANEHRRNQEYWTQLRSRVNEPRVSRNAGSSQANGPSYPSPMSIEYDSDGNARAVTYTEPPSEPSNSREFTMDMADYRFTAVWEPREDVEPVQRAYISGRRSGRTAEAQRRLAEYFRNLWNDNVSEG